LTLAAALKGRSTAGFDRDKAHCESLMGVGLLPWSSK